MLVCAVVAAACGDGSDATTSPTATTPSAPSVSTSATMSPTSSPDPTPSGSPIPEGAVLVEPDTDPDDLDVDVLAPGTMDVTGTWFGSAAGTDVAVVAAAGAGDAFSRRRALWVWTRRADLGGWLGVEAAAYPAARGVLGLDAVVADVTGDGDDDALVFALTGGSGACGTWTVLDLAVVDGIFAREVCDASVDPSHDPVGLLVTESVYRAGDPHCCPSARRETVLTYAGDGDWTVERREVTQLG
jgi:hypothetical protein